MRQLIGRTMKGDAAFMQGQRYLRKLQILAARLKRTRVILSCGATVPSRSPMMRLPAILKSLSTLAERGTACGPACPDRSAAWASATPGR